MGKLKDCELEAIQKAGKNMKNWQTTHKAYDIGKPSEKVKQMILELRRLRDEDNN